MKFKTILRTTLLVLVSCALSVSALTAQRAITDRFAVRQINAACVSVAAPGYDDCVARQLAKRAVSDGDADGIYRLVVLMEGGKPGFSKRCNLLMSNAGGNAYDLQPHFETFTFGPDSTRCNYAFMQTYVRRVAVVSGAAAARDFCGLIRIGLAKTVPGAAGECYRGIGQGLPFNYLDTQPDPSRMTVKSIKQCENVTDVAEYRALCVSGVFQYIDLEESRGGYGLSPMRPDPLALCESQPVYADECYSNTKRVLFNALSPGGASDYADALRMIRGRFPGVSTHTMQTVTHTLAYDTIYAEEPGPDYAALARQCAGIEESLRPWCRWGASTAVAKNAPSGTQPDQLMRLCEAYRASMGDEAASACISAAGDQFLAGILPPAEFDALCRKYSASSGACGLAHAYAQ